MAYYIFKVVITAVLVVIIAELSKRYTLAGALLASVPLVSVMAMLWLYIDTGDTARIAAFSQQVFWLVLPSLLLFITLPRLLPHMGFFPALGVSMLISAAGYLLILRLITAPS